MTDEQVSSPKIERFKFTGQAGEFFGIWFVNNLLTMMTLGIYSPWAKVRNLQYFYGNTHLAGGSFQFTANPVTMLRSRIIAVLLFVLYIVSDIASDQVDSTLGTIVLITLAVAYFIFAPVLTVYIVSFRLRYSAWRGMAFKFNKDFKGAYRVYLAPLTLMLLFLSSFYLPLNSEKVEGLLGLDPYVAAGEADSEAETETAEPLIEDLQSAEDLQPQDEDLQYESELATGVTEPLDEDLQYESELATGVTEPLDEDLLYEESADESGEPDAGNAGEEDEYVNPYLFIPAGILLLLNLLLLPYFDFINNRFLARNTQFGTAKWRYTATAGQYYAVYAKFSLITLVFALAGAGIIMGDFGKGAQVMLGILLVLLYFSAARAYLKSRRYNLLFNNIEIQGGYRLQAEIPFLRFFFLVITNSIAVTLTFGLMAAWAQIRTAALMLEYTALSTPDSMDKFVAAQQQDNSALAEEVGDVFDLEIGM